MSHLNPIDKIEMEHVRRRAQWNVRGWVEMGERGRVEIGGLGRLCEKAQFYEASFRPRFQSTFDTIAYMYDGSRSIKS